MVFKKIDRYVGASFLMRLFGIALVLGLLYVIFDLLKKLDEIQEVGLANAVQTISSYYACMLPIFLVDIVPALVLVAAGLVLTSMARKRELLALKASGTSVYRVIAPIFFWTLIVNVAAFGFREVTGPDFAQRREVLNRVLDNEVEHDLLLRDEEFHRKLYVGQYSFPERTLKDICVVEDGGSNGNVGLQRVIQADFGSWNAAGELVLEDVEVRQMAQTPEGEGAAEPRVLPTFTLETHLTSFDFVEAAEEESGSVTLMHTLPELRALIRRQPDIPLFRVLFHSRLASFFYPFVLLLVGVPWLVGFEHSVESRFLSIIVGILVAAGFYTLTFVFASMGKTLTLPPILAGWLPTITATAAGLWLFESMHT